MKYGCRAHDYGSFTAQELARTLADQGYNAAQLAMPKAIRGIADMNGISPEQLEEIWLQTSPMKSLPRSTASCIASKPAKA